jgi:hypothetical protein
MKRMLYRDASLSTAHLKYAKFLGVYDPMKTLLFWYLRTVMQMLLNL